MQLPTITIERGRPQDLPQLLGLIKELAEYERQPDAVTVTLEELLADGFGPNPIYGFFTAKTEDKTVGMALWYIRYSTWKGRSLYLEDIYVQPEFRGNKIGDKLLKAIAEQAIAINCKRICFQALDWNTPALNFYAKYGANQDAEWVNLVLEPEWVLGKER